MSFRQFFSSKLRTDHDTFVGKTGSITYYNGNLYFHDGQTPGGLRIDQDSGINGESFATESYVDGRVDQVIGMAPAALDTLKELADALGNDADFATSLTNLLADKASVIYVDNQVTNLVSTFNTSLATKASITYVDLELGELADTVNAAIAAIQAAVDSEVLDRAAADNTLQNNINAEASDRAAADTVLQNNINAEATARATADNNLQININSLTSSLSAESVARQNADDALDSLIDAEVAARQQADGNLAGDIADETAARISADNALQTAIDLEATARSNADTAIQVSLATETADRQAADETLQDNIDAEVAARGAAINSEATVRANADNALQTAINNEAAARAQGDQDLQDNLDAVEASYIAADATLNAAITQEVSNRIAAVSSESAARAAADADLQDQIDFIKENTDPATLDSLKEIVDAFQSSGGDVANNIATINTTLVTLQGANDTEAAARAEADETLQDNIDAEALARQNADASLQSQIDNIVSNIDPTALDSLTEIVAAFQTADGSLTSTINNLQTTLQGNVEAVAGDLAAETTNRTNADLALQSNIDAEALARAAADETLQNNIDAEATARASAVNTLQSDLNGEIADRQAADTLLQTNIDSEATARQESDTSILASLAQEVADRQTAVSSEAADRQAADETLQSNIDAEAAARAGADTTLQSNIDAEVLARQSADTTLQNNIDAEVLARQSADTTLQSNIDTEESARIAADTTLQTNISNEAVARIAGDADLQDQINNIVSNIDPAALDSLSELASVIQTSLPTGLEGQVPFIKTDGTRETEQEYLIKVGQFVETNQEYLDAQGEVPTNADIFNSWTRFSHNNTETQPASASEITAWVYDEANDIIRCTVNSGTYIGFISTDTFENYGLEVKLTSTDSDNDTIGVVIAWYVDPATGREYTLSALRDTGGNGNAWEIWYNYRRSDAKLIADGSSFLTTGGGWAAYPDGTLIRITRAGDQITAETTQLNSSTYLTGSAVLTVDLTSDPDLAKFQGKRSYGFAAFSQGQASFQTLNFTGASVPAIYDMRDGTVYTRTGTTWATDPTKSVWSEIGIGRIVYDQLFTKMYYIKDSATIIKVTPDLASFATVASLTAEITARESADAALQTDIDAIAADLASEINNRFNSDSTLQSNIDAETTARQADVTTLQGNIDAEISARESADTNLQNQIDNIVSNIDPTALDSLTEIVAAFQSSDSNLLSDLSNVSAGLSTKLNTADFDTTADTWLGTKTMFTITDSPVNSTDATNKAYVDSQVSSLSTSSIANGTSSASLPDADGNFVVSLNGGDKQWTFDVVSGDLTLAGDIINGQAGINFVPNSSGDGAGYTTIELRPDSNASQDQYLIIDPTAPSHIHIRAGGTQDQSNADLFLGGEKTHVLVSDSNGSVRISQQEESQTFSATINAGLDYSTAEWTSDGVNHQITFNDVQQTTLNAIWGQNGSTNNIEIYDGSNYVTVQTLGSSTPGLGQSAVVYVNQAPATSPTSVVTAYFNSIDMVSTFVEVNNRDVRIEAQDDLRMFSRDVFLLANYSTTDSIRIATNYNNNEKSWDFGIDGVLQVPGAVNFLQNNTIPLGAPEFGGATDRIRLWDFAGGGSGFNYAIGAEGNHVWFAMDVNDGTGGFKFYSRDNQVFKIRDDGALLFADDTIQTSAWTGTVDWTNVNSKPTFATVATSGSYNDLSDLPILTTSQLINNSTTLTLDSTGKITLPQGSVVNESGAVNCATGVATTIYTATSDIMTTVKVLVQVEEFAGTNQIQASEVMVVKPFGVGTVMSSIYGTVYSGTGPLATFTAELDGSNNIVIKCTPTGANMLTARVVATEIVTSD